MYDVYYNMYDVKCMMCKEQCISYDVLCTMYYDIPCKECVASCKMSRVWYVGVNVVP